MFSGVAQEAKDQIRASNRFL